MKKVLSVILCVLLLASIMSMAVSANASYGEVKKVSEGDITLDGYANEPAWANALQIPINRLSPSSPNQDRAMIDGFAKFLWTEKGVYVYFEINDTTPTSVPAEDKEADGAWNWNIDCFELFFNPRNTGDVLDVLHFTVDSTGWGKAYVHADGVNYYGADKDPYFTFVQRTEGSKYIGEYLVHIPGISYKAGDQIGILLQIDDMTESDMTNGGDRVVVLAPNSNGADSWDCDKHDYIVLSGDLAYVPPVEDVVEDAPVAQDNTPAAESKPSSPKTSGSVTIIFAVLAMAASAVTVSKKRTTK